MKFRIVSRRGAEEEMEAQRCFARGEAAFCSDVERVTVVAIVKGPAVQRYPSAPLRISSSALSA